MTYGFALNRAISLQIYFFCVKHQVKNEFLEDVKRRVDIYLFCLKKGKRKDQGVPQSQTEALPRHQEDEETDKSKQAQIDQTYEKH